MAGERIQKSERAGWPTPNLQDYAEVRSGFSWEQARSALRGVQGGGLNIAFEAVDRHLDDGLPEGTLSLADVLDACPDSGGLVATQPDADLRASLDLDSMDFVYWVAALHRRLGVDIPELDCPKLRTLDATAAYLRARLEAGACTLH